MEDAYSKTADEVLKYFNVSEKLGLTQEEVKRSRQKYGLNGQLFVQFLMDSNLAKMTMRAWLYLLNFLPKLVRICYLWCS